MKLKLKITDTIPVDLEEGILYVSFKYWTTAHKCGCGCGQKVVLRIGPKYWAITLNGESVSMYPSVGNWQLPCQSHYWIEAGQILPAENWSDAEILRNRKLMRNKRTFDQMRCSRQHDMSLKPSGDSAGIASGENENLESIAEARLGMKSVHGSVASKSCQNSAEKQKKPIVLCRP